MDKNEGLQNEQKRIAHDVRMEDKKNQLLPRIVHSEQSFDCL